MGTIKGLIREEDFDKAEGFVQSPFMNEEGRYLCRIIQHNVGISQNDETVIKFIPEFEVLQTAHGLHPIGSRRSDVVMIPTKSTQSCKTMIGRAKAHLAGITNRPQSSLRLNNLLELEDSPLKYEGTLFWLDILPVKTTKKGVEINPRQYIHIPKDQYQAVLSEARAHNTVYPVETVITQSIPPVDDSVAEADQDW